MQKLSIIISTYVTIGVYGMCINVGIKYIIINCSDLLFINLVVDIGTYMEKFCVPNKKV